MSRTALSDNFKQLQILNSTDTKCKNFQTCCQVTFRTIVASPNAFFKNQQRGDPDLTDEEKFAIVEDLFRNDPEKFLERYWKLLSKDDIHCLDHIPSSDLLDGYKEQVLKRFHNKPLNPHAVKNRRFRKMMELIKEGDYFSEEEMKNRDPLAYEQMIGKFLDSKDTKPCLNQQGHMLSTFFISHLQVMQNNELYLKQVEEEQHYLEHENVSGNMDERVDEDCEDEREEEENDMGEYEVRKDGVSSITSMEKDYLRKEFIDIMKEKFLRGEDSEFNYEEVDNNEELDSFDIINRDAEDKYFDDDDDNEDWNDQFGGDDDDDGGDDKMEL